MGTLFLGPVCFVRGEILSKVSVPGDPVGSQAGHHPGRLALALDPPSGHEGLAARLNSLADGSGG